MTRIYILIFIIAILGGIGYGAKYYYDTTQNKSITLKEISECKYEVFKVTYLNRSGA